MPMKARGSALRNTIAKNDPMGADGIYGNLLTNNAPTVGPAPTPTPAVIPPVTPVGGGGGAGTGGGQSRQIPFGGVRSDQDLFNRAFGTQQADGSYVAGQVIANTMQNRNVLPSPVNYAQQSLSPSIQRRVNLFGASNPADALRNPPAGPAMARDNGQAISRMTPLVPPAVGGAQSVRGGKSPVPAVPRPAMQQRPSKMPRGGA